MNKIDLAYTAGIIDGEGSISIARHTSKSCKRGYCLELYVQVSSSDEWLCRWLKFGFGGSCCLGKTLNSAGHEMWHWTIVSRKALGFLELVSPYLHIKKPQAELAMSFQKSKKRNPNKSDEELGIEEAQRILLKNMHCRQGWHPKKELRQEFPKV